MISLVIAGHGFGARRVCRITAQHEAIILNGGATARRVDDDRIQAIPESISPRPGVNITPSGVQCSLFLTHMVGKRAAAPALDRIDDLDVMTIEQADRCLIDGGIEHLLSTAGKQGNPRAALALS